MIRAEALSQMQQRPGGLTCGEWAPTEPYGDWETIQTLVARAYAAGRQDGADTEAWGRFVDRSAEFAERARSLERALLGA